MPGRLARTCSKIAGASLRKVSLSTNSTVPEPGAAKPVADASSSQAIDWVAGP